MKLADVVRCEALFEEKIVRNKTLPANVAFEYYPLCEIMQKFRDSRDDIIRKYGEANGGSGQFFIKFESPNYPQYAAEVEKLLTAKIKFEPVVVSKEDIQAGGLTLGDAFDLRAILVIQK